MLRSLCWNICPWGERLFSGLRVRTFNTFLFMRWTIFQWRQAVKMGQKQVNDNTLQRLQDYFGHRMLNWANGAPWEVSFCPEFSLPGAMAFLFFVCLSCQYKTWTRVTGPKMILFFQISYFEKHNCVLFFWEKLESLISPILVFVCVWQPESILGYWEFKHQKLDGGK